MSYVIGVGGQKGGTAKTTIATSAAVQASRSGLNVILYDLDHTQQTANMWAQRRRENGYGPDIKVSVTTRSRIPAVLSDEDMSILDLPGFADAKTAGIAQYCELFLLPTGTGLNDLDTTILVAHELITHGIPHDRLYFVLTRAPDERAAQQARDYIHKAGYATLKGYSRSAKSVEQALNQGLALTEVKSPKLQGEALEIFNSLAEELTRERLQIDISAPEQNLEEEKCKNRERSS